MDIADRIKFDPASDDIIIQKFPSEELRLGSQLIVNQSQEALFVKDGVGLDLFGPGRHTITSDNISLLRKLINLPFSGRTPFTAEIWFINKTVKRDMKWGTPQPVLVLDPKYNYPISVRSFGQWGFKVSDSRLIIAQIVGAQMDLDSYKILSYFSGEINQQVSASLSDVFSKEKISVFEANSNLNNLSLIIGERIGASFNRFGIDIINFNIESINIPQEEKEKIQGVLEKRMEVEQFSQVNPTGSYATVKSFGVLDKVASTGEGASGLLSTGLGAGLGMGLGVQMGQTIASNATAGNMGNSPTATSPTDRLVQLKSLFDMQLITQDEYDKKKAEILGAL